MSSFSRAPRGIASIMHRLQLRVSPFELRWFFAYGLIRLALAGYSRPRMFPTSGQLLWHGSKTTAPYGVAAIYSLTGSGTTTIVVQTVIAVFAWTWLMHEVLHSFSRKNRIGVIFGVVIAAVSLSAPVVVWDRTLLPESLRLSALVMVAAAWMMLQRRRGDRGARNAALCVLVVSAITSGLLFFLVALPIAVASWRRRLDVRARALAMIAVVVLSILSVRPSSVAFGPLQTSGFANRAMNIVGERILPDVGLRRRLENDGLPKNLDPSFYRARPASGDDWMLFRNAELRSFAESFPIRAYVGALLDRPSLAIETAFQATDGRLITDSPDIGADGDELIPQMVANVFWGWNASVHFALLVLAFASLSQLRKNPKSGSIRFGAAALRLSLITTVLTYALAWTDGSAGVRETLPLMAVGRLALMIGVLDLAIIWTRITLTVDQSGLVRLVRGGAARRQVSKMMRVVFIALIVGASMFTVLLTFRGKNTGPSVQSEPASSRLVKQVEAQLRGRNVVVSPRVHGMLKVVLGPWERREDLQVTMSNPDGLPNIEAVTLWARGFPDSSTESFARHLGAIDELRSRLGLIGDTGIVPVLYWTLQNEPNLNHDFTNIIGHLADLWNGRPEIRARFTDNGRVDVVAFLTEANAIEATDPIAANVPFDFFVVREAIVELTRDND